MPVLRYYDGSKFVDLPGVAGPPGPPGPPGPAATPGMVAQAWLSVTTTSSQPLQVVAPGLKAGRNYLVSGYAIASNNSAGVATYRCVITTAAAAGNPSAAPGTGAYLAYQANLAGDQVPAGCYTDGCSASFVYSPTVDGDVTFIMYSLGTAGAFTFAAGNAAMSVIDISGAPGPAGPQGPAGPAGGGSIIASVRAHRTAAWSATAAGGVLIMDTEDWDTQNAYNPATGVFTVPVAGKYHVACSLAAQSTAVGQWLGVALYKNGATTSQKIESVASASQWFTSEVVDILDCKVGDTISVAQSALATLAGNTNFYWTYLTIDLLSGTGPQGAPGPTGPPGTSTDLYRISYYQTIPALKVASNPYTLTHNLGTRGVLVQAWDSVTQQLVNVQVTTFDLNTIQLVTAQDMPNPLNVVVMGVANALYPVNAGDLATKAYVDLRTPNLPAPVTSGSTIQSFTDAIGDVWVALNGVNGGNWRRARDVLHARWYKTAAQNTVVGVVAVTLEAAQRDVYGMWSGAAFVAPVSGLYLCSGQITVNAGAAGQTYSTRWYIGGQYQTVTQMLSPAAGGLSIPSTMIWYMNAGDGFQPTVTASAVVAITTASFWTFAEIDYLGTG